VVNVDSLTDQLPWQLISYHYRWLVSTDGACPTPLPSEIFKVTRSALWWQGNVTMIRQWIDMTQGRLRPTKEREPTVTSKESGQNSCVPRAHNVFNTNFKFHSIIRSCTVAICTELDDMLVAGRELKYVSCAADTFVILKSTF